MIRILLIFLLTISARKHILYSTKLRDWLQYELIIIIYQSQLLYTIENLQKGKMVDGTISIDCSKCLCWCFWSDKMSMDMIYFIMSAYVSTIMMLHINDIIPWYSKVYNETILENCLSTVSKLVIFQHIIGL